MNEYKQILKQENYFISSIIECQKRFRLAINEKNWSALMDESNSINLFMNNFNELDKKREKISQSNIKFDAETCSLLASVRSKLLKVRIENKIMSDYVGITKKFVQGILDTALPQSRNQRYCKTGVIKEQPQSVVVSVNA